MLVVQAYAYGKYLGKLLVTFDDAGHVMSWNGNPVLLHGGIEQDPELLSEVSKYKEPLYNFTNNVIGETRVVLDGDSDSCRQVECNMGKSVLLVTPSECLLQYIL